MSDQDEDRDFSQTEQVRPFFHAVLFGLLALLATGAAILAPDPGVRLGFVTSSGVCLLGATYVTARDGWKFIQRRRAMSAAVEFISHDASPCFCTNSDGAILFQNAASVRRFGECRDASMSRAISAALPNAAAVIFRLESAIDQRPSSHEIVVTPRGALRVSAHRFREGIMWRLDDMADVHSRPGEWIGLPMMVVSHNNTVLSMNAAMRDVLGRRATTLEDVFPDQPLVAGARTLLSGVEGRLEVIPVVVPSKDGRREIYAVPGRAEPPAASVAARAFEALPVALLHIGSKGEVLATNPDAQKLLGIDETYSGPLSDLVENLGRPVRDWVADALAGRLANRSEVARAKLRKEETFLQISISRIADGTGPSLLAVFHDATELKNLELQFVQSQKMQAIGELAGGVAHDFNNLLTAITGHCDLLLLRHDQGDPDYADLIQINQNANRAASLVGQLLAFSRKQTLEPEIVDLRDSIGDLTHLLNRLVGERIHLTLSNDPALAPIRADRRQMEQVIMNLVVNARDAMMPKGGEIRVETRMVHLAEPMRRDRAVVPPGSYVTIRIRDEGTGIPTDKLDRIFEPFWTTKRAGEGTGLGLSMAYGIIKQTGGFIFLDSVVGAGTTFTIYIPAHVDGETVAEETPVAVVSPKPGPARGSDPGVVLLVEDEAPVRAFASRALQLRGYKVIEAGCAEDALELLDDPDLKVDIFVTDIVMPGMDGPSWVREALKKRPHTKVVFVSGYAEDAMQDGAIDVPGSIFLPKPFSLSALTDSVRRQLH